MAEARTPPYIGVQSPRIGGCKGAFFQLFDWNLSKRFASSTKRLPADRLDKLLGKSKTVRDELSAGARTDVHREYSPSAKTVSLETSVVTEADGCTKPPELVGHSTGLEALPEESFHFQQRLARNTSRSESISHSKMDSRQEKIALRDFLDQEHDSFEKSMKSETLLVPVKFKEQQEKRVKQSTLQTPVKSLVPYVDSPARSCRSVYSLPYVLKGEKSQVLSRLHPSPVLQPSKYHNQMASPGKHPEMKKGTSRFLESAVKILEEISDSEQRLPRERTGMGADAEFSPLSSGNELLRCDRSVSKFWSEDSDLVGSHSRSLLNGGSVTLRESQRRDRVSREIFDRSFSERAESLSPSPRRPPKKRAGFPNAGTNEAKGRGILRTQEASVANFKSDVRKPLAGARKSRSKTSLPSLTDSALYSHHTTGSMRDRKSFRSKSRTFSNGFEAINSSTSDEGSLTDQLSSTAVTLPMKSKSLEVYRLTGVLKVEGNWKVSFLADISQPETELQSSTRTIPTQQFSGWPEDLNLSFGIKKDSPCQPERQVIRGAPGISAAPDLLCQSEAPSSASLKRSRRMNRQGSMRVRENPGPSSVTRGSETRSPPLSRHGEYTTQNLEAVSSSGREEIILSGFPLNLDSALPSARNVAGCEANLLGQLGDFRFKASVPSLESRPNLQHIQGPARGLFSIPDSGRHPVQQEVTQPNLEEFLILGMDDLHWDDGMIDHQKDISSRARYCEIRTSDESMPSICGSLDEDVCNIDDESSPFPLKFSEESFGTDEDDESLTPVLMKHFLDKPARLEVDTGETSPLSVLEWPVDEDELSATSETSIAESEQRVDESLEDNVLNLSELIAELEREINSFKSKSHEHELTSQCMKGALITFDEEKAFVREVLSAAQLLSSPSRSPNWFERDLAVDPSLFDRLESGRSRTVIHEDILCDSGDPWLSQCNRKLLFDCVNEAFSQDAKHLKEYPQPWLSNPVMRKRSVGHNLVQVVHEKINGWRELASHAIDTLIDIDMSTRVGKWTDFSEEAAEVGIEIECLIWEVIIEEIALDLAATLH